MKRPGGWGGSTRESRLPPNWRSELVPAAFDAYGTACYVCGSDGADTIDHVVPGDDHSLDNLRPIHDAVYPHCHRRKSSEEGHQARAQIRAQGKVVAEPHPGLR